MCNTIRYFQVKEIEMIIPDEEEMEIIDLTADTESEDSDDDDFLEDCERWWCSCGEEISQHVMQHYDHMCADCHWFSQLTEDDWTAIFDLHDRFN